MKAIQGTKTTVIKKHQKKKKKRCKKKKKDTLATSNIGATAHERSSSTAIKQVRNEKRKKKRNRAHFTFIFFFYFLEACMCVCVCVCGDGGGSWEEVHCCRAVQLLFFFFLLPLFPIKSPSLPRLVGYRECVVTHPVHQCPYPAAACGSPRCTRAAPYP